MTQIKNRTGIENGPRTQITRIPLAWQGFFRFAQVTLFLLLCTTGAAAESRSVAGQILVKPRAGLAEADFAARLAGHGATHRQTLRHLNVRVINVAESRTEAVLAALQSDPDIEFAERDYMARVAFVPNDPLVVSGDEWHVQKIQAPQAWDITVGNPAAIVAILDSGIMASHPEFAGRILPGYDFVSNDTNTTDDFGHGTAVAGIIVAAGNNAVGVAGVAYGCSVLPVKVVDSSGFASYSSIAQGIKYAVDHGARVINMSIAGDSPSTTLQGAIDYAWSNNVVLVAAAGNNANTLLQYPAACEHVVAVSATEPDDSLASFSSYGGFITLSAPGDNMWTTQRELSNPYGAWRGTSFASPVVAGVALLAASANPSLSNTQIVSLLEQTADDLGVAGYDISFGYGRINAFRAVSAASAAPGGGPPVPPVLPPINPDTVRPSVTIISGPRAGARLASPAVSFTGTARDDVGVQRVELQINSGTIEIAEGTTNWTATLDLVPGPNVVHVRSVDLAGNTSVEVTRACTYVVNVPLIVQTKGMGRVTPDFSRRLLEIGRTYRLRAVPGPGQVFIGWEGMSSASPLLSFVMQSNLTLVADFIPSPFPAVTGNYAGLMANTNGITADSSGCFSLTIARSGGFSGRLVLGDGSHGFRGQLNLAGEAEVSLRRGLLPPLTMALHVDLANAGDQIAGQVSDGNWTSQVEGDRNVFSARLNPAPQAGLRSFILERADDNTRAAAGSSRISASGAARVLGKLEDGRPFALASTLSKNGDYPFFLSLDRGAEIVIGWLNFPATQNPTIGGTVLWLKSGTNTFATTLQAAAAPP